MDFSPLRTFLEEACDSRLPGADVRVYRNGSELFSFHTGYSDAENEIPVEGGEVWPAYSLTKLMTCTCAMMAQEEGLLKLDTPLKAYLPEFSRMQVSELTPQGRIVRPSKNDILIEHLFTMTAGFGPDMNLLPHEETLSAVCALSKQPLLCDPGSHWLYGLSHDVLGAVLEVICGLPLRRVFEKRLYAPLGLRSTRFLSEVRDLSLLAPLYRAQGDSYKAISYDMTYAPSSLYDSGGAGIVTSAGDYIRFLDALCTGKLLDHESLTCMCRDRLNADMRRDFCWPQLNGYGYGLGLRVPPEGSRLMDAGWGGAAGGYALMDIHRQVSMCFFTNVLGADEKYLYSGLRDALYRSLGDAFLAEH